MKRNVIDRLERIDGCVPVQRRSGPAHVHRDQSLEHARQRGVDRRRAPSHESSATHTRARPGNRK